MTTEQRDALRISRVRDQIWRRLPVRTNDGVLPMAGMSVLDLAARTGAFSIALSVEGADVVAVEGRESNLELWPEVPDRVRRRIRKVRADVRGLSRPILPCDPPFGRFDVVLCLGILYHLERDDAERLLADVFTRTRPGGIAIIDTHVGGHPQAEPGGMADPWGAIGNTESWWLAHERVHALLLGGVDVGDRFARVDYLGTPAYEGEPPSRKWFVATRGGAA